MQEIKCNVCGDGVFISKEKFKNFSHNGKTESLKMLGFECNVCNSSYTTNIQSKANKRTITAFKKKADGLLSGEEIATIREKLKINKSEAAIYFGGGPVAFSKYESDDVTQSEAMDNLLRVAYAYPEVAMFLKARTEGQYSSIDSIPIRSAQESRLNVSHITQFFSFLIEQDSRNNTWRSIKDIHLQDSEYSGSQLTKYIYNSIEKIKDAENPQKVDGYSSDDIPQRRTGDNVLPQKRSTSRNWNITQCLH
jgi:putative zinc finger/helix-turn-helix YgiT family protein